MALSLGFLGGMFGRSLVLRRLDDALRARDLHPRLVPEAVKLALVRLIGGEEAGEARIDRAAHLLAYCMLGAGGFAAANSPGAVEAAEARIEAALRAGDTQDARIVLLAMQAGVIQPSVVETFGLETG